MKKVFFDTWGWVAAAHKDDNRHREVAAYYRDFLVRGGTPVTTDYVLAETATLLRARTAPGGVAIFIDALLTASRAKKILLERITAERWEAAWKLCKKFDDKPGISFTDFTSFIVMRELRLSYVVTTDRHFEQAGFGFSAVF